MEQNKENHRYMLTINEASAVFGIGASTLRELVRTDTTMPILKVGSHVKINSGLFREWLDKATKERRIIGE